MIATGSVSTTVDWPGLNATGVQGLYGLPDLESMEQHTKGIDRAVVVGGGLIGIEMAEMLHSRHINVSLLVRDSHYWSSVLAAEEGQLIGRHVQQHGVDLQLKTELKEILADGTGRVRAILPRPTIRKLAVSLWDSALE